MTSEELSTAVINKLPVKVFVIDNCYLGMVRQWQELFYEDRKSGVDMVGNPDFVKLGEAYGVKGFLLDQPENVEKVIAEVLAYNDGPCIIHAKVMKTDNVFPMIPSGAGYKDMVIDTPEKQLEKPSGST